MTTSAHPASTYSGTRTAVAAAAEFVELFADIEITDLYAYDNDGPTLSVTLADESNATARRVAAVLGLTDGVFTNDGRRLTGPYDDRLGGFWRNVWVSVDLYPTEELTRAQMFWWRNRSRVAAAGLVAAGSILTLAAGRIVQVLR